ncbi:Lreu_0056 family protein [Liquorilactobacillus satsumensis]|uniref:Lreu_0056 family protein n=1 Tax=Liquorilactobacillus satsumensis TaxID=259059 RepID=UPI0039ED0BAA
MQKRIFLEVTGILTILGVVGGCSSQNFNTTRGSTAKSSLTSAKKGSHNEAKSSATGKLDSNPASESNSETNTSSATTNTDNRAIGVMIALLVSPKWFKEYIGQEMYYEPNNSQSGNNTQGYSYITANGDPTSYLYFKVSGGNVIYKRWIPSTESVATGYMETKTVTVQQLRNYYYSNAAQKAEVDGYVKELKPESNYRGN